MWNAILAYTASPGWSIGLIFAAVAALSIGMTVLGAFVAVKLGIFPYEPRKRSR